MGHQFCQKTHQPRAFEFIQRINIESIRAVCLIAFPLIIIRPEKYRLGL